MELEVRYVRTEFDRITFPVLERYDRLGRERGLVLVPLDSSGRDADGNVPGDFDLGPDGGAPSDPSGDPVDLDAAREDDRGALDGSGFGDE